MNKHVELMSYYRKMLFIRCVEEEIAARYGKAGEPQEMRCPVHLSIGQEAVAVGVCEALAPTDVIFSTHRCHAHYLAKGGALEPMLAEIYGKETGCVGGRGGSMHLMDKDAGILASVPIVASCIPLTVGAALSFSFDAPDRIAATFIGDAALEEGVWHESANFAKLRNLPVVFICENNLYSVYTPIEERQPKGALTRFAQAHDLFTIEADGNDVSAVNHAALEAVNHARSGKGPAFLLFDTYRYREHCGTNYDDHLGYRPDGERENWEARDPVLTLRTTLLEQGVLSEADEQAILDEFMIEIDKTFDVVRASPLPKAETVSDYMFA